MRKNLISGFVAITVLLAGCAFQREVPNTPAGSNTTGNTQTANIEKPNFTKESYPKVDGSTATIPLSQGIASSLLGLSKEEAVKFVKHNTTPTAYTNLFNKTVDIILVTEPSEDELKSAKNAGIELEVIPVVKEGFVFLVNRANPVNTLTLKQVQDIYQGKIVNWKEVGGADREIIAYQRDKNSGSQTLMEQKVMKGLRLKDAPKTVIPDMEGLIESIAKYDNSERALGYSVFYYAKTMYSRDTIKLLAINGVLPANDTIASGKYPLTAGYYAVIRKGEPENSAARKLIAWLLSPEGQKLAEEAGYVPLKEGKK